jgi:transcriptional regulator with XRE-family HTH domain
VTKTTLGAELSNVRSLSGKSLKTVAAEAEISPAYLQKLEGDEVKTPSPNILFKLSEALEVPYATLMDLAGYVVPATEGSSATPFEAAFDSSDLSAKERRAVAEFVKTLRSLRDDD